jgi:hypothetical protein
MLMLTYVNLTCAAHDYRSSPLRTFPDGGCTHPEVHHMVMAVADVRTHAKTLLIHK